MTEAPGSVINLLESLSNIRTRIVAGKQSTHKFVFILALLRLYEVDNKRPNKFYLNSELETSFQNIWTELHGENPEINAIEHPFYHLQSDGIWFLSAKKGFEQLYESYKNAPNMRLTKKRLLETVEYGYLRDDFHTSFQNSTVIQTVTNFLRDKCRQSIEESDSSMALQHLELNINDMSAPNPFVAYLNSLHSRDAGNENALAEAQACNPNFSRIYVRHPLVDSIVQCLTEDAGKSVVLTGHAGDGKSTIALAVYKQLKKIDEHAVLSVPLQRREDIVLPNGIYLAIIKDFSEWQTHERDNLLADVMANKIRVLLVTNTGALLDAFCGYAAKSGLGNRAEWEPRLLEAMDAESNNFLYGPVPFVFFNIALCDNLELARLIFHRILSNENWGACENQACREHCPIYRNVALFQVNSSVANRRLFLAYRRMYEYGTRLTIRQLTAHLAYLLTAGMEYTDIRHLAEREDKPLMSEFLFYNRFFGDDGHTEDQAAVRMPVIHEVRAQGFGERPCPATERHLWLLTHGDDFSLGVPLLEEEFRKLRRYGSQMQKQENGLTPDQAREQVRRMLYFLHDNKDVERGNAFLRQFLGSLAIIKWEHWQDPSARLSMDEGSHFKQRVFHVLQEQFTGVRLPEVGGPGQQSHLYITLSRHKQDIRQSAQVVLAQIDFSNEFKIGLGVSAPKSQRRDLVLTGQDRLNGICLNLSLPFLDYVLARHQGEVGETLQAAYADRLERLKAELINRCRSHEDDEMLLVRLRTNHTFLRQHYAIAEGKLEVSNA